MNLRLWSILELLTGKNEGENYDVVVARTAGLFRDPAYHGLILENLRRHRNDVVHNDAASLRSKDYLVLLRSYVVELIMFHIAEGKLLGGFSGACDYLGLPHDRQLLKKSLNELSEQARLRRILLERMSQDAGHGEPEANAG